MLKYLPIVVVSVILAWLSHRFSRYNERAFEYQKKEYFFYCMMVVLMVLFVGLRTRYNDTTAYIHSYESMNVTNSLLEINWTIGMNPGYNIVSLMLKKAGFSTQSFLMFYAAVTVTLYAWFIRKYTCNIWLSIFLFVTMGVYSFTLAAIKQTMAVAFCLVATDYFIRKRYVGFIVWIVVAMLFHPYSLMFFILPFLTFKPWSIKTVVLLCVFGLGGLLLRPLIGTVVSITTLLGEEYDASSFTGEGVNPFRLAVVLVPVVVSLPCSRIIGNRNDKVQNLFLNLSTLNACIMFVGLFGTANYFGRLANYFLIFQVITIPWLFTCFNKKNRVVISSFAIIGYIMYMIYGNAINQQFDSLYSSVSLFEYLKNLI